MLWQAEAGLRFKMASGYVVPPEAPDPYKRDPAYPTLTSGARVPDVEGAAEFFLYTHHVTVAVVDPSLPQATPWIPILERLGWKAQHGGRRRRVASRVSRAASRTGPSGSRALKPFQNPV